MTHHHPSESNPRPLEHETVARTAPLSLELAAASRPGTLCAIASSLATAAHWGVKIPGSNPGIFIPLRVDVIRVVFAEVFHVTCASGGTLVPAFGFGPAK